TRIRRNCGWQAGEAVARRVRCDAVDDARDAVAEHVVASQRSEGAARERTTDQAGAQRARAAVQIGEDRVDVAGPFAAGWQRALTVWPAVVPPGDPEVDLLDRLVADVPDPERPGAAVEAHPEGVPEPVGPDLAARTCGADERVVGGDRPVEIEPKDLSVERGEILGVRVRRGPRAALVVAVTRIADANVELLVGPDAQHTAVVVAVVGADAVDEDGEGAGVHAAACQRAAHDLIEPSRRCLTAARAGLRAVEVDETGAREVRVDGDTEEAHLRIGTYGKREERRRAAAVEELERRRPGATGAALLGDEEPAVGQEGDRGRVGEPGHVWGVEEAGYRIPGQGRARHDGGEQEDEADVVRTHGERLAERATGARTRGTSRYPHR